MKNREYWSQRFALLEEAQNNKANEYLDTLKKEYEKSLLEIEKDITNWYTRLADNNEISYANAITLLEKKELKEFKWTVEEYIQKGKENVLNQQWIKELENASAKVHIEKLEAIKIQIQNELEQLYDKQDKGVTNLVKQQYQDAYYKSAYEIQKGLEHYWNIQPLDTNKIERIISKPWTTDNRTFSDRIWNNKEQLLSALQKDLTQATIRGDDLQDVINKISKDFNTFKNRASTLVMTESAFFSSVGQKECFNNLGVEKYEIVATLDSHTSEICQELDGKVFDMKDYQEGITAPPFHVNCRTTTVPYFNDEFTQNEKRFYRDENGKTGYVNANMKYRGWKEKYVTDAYNSDIITNKLGNANSNSIGGNGKGQFIEKVNKDQINEKLREYENDIKNMSIEYAVVIDKDNNVYAYSGDKNNVSISDINLKNCILTHNHPEIGSFGKDDFELIKANTDIKELRAVDNQYTYNLRLLKEIDISYSDIYKEGLQLAFETGEEDRQHCVMKKLQERGYIKYDRKRKKIKQ